MWMRVRMFGKSVTFLPLSAEHLQVSQAFSQIALQRHGVGGIAFRAASNRAVRVGPEEHQRIRTLKITRTRSRSSFIPDLKPQRRLLLLSPITICVTPEKQRHLMPLIKVQAGKSMCTLMFMYSSYLHIHCSIFSYLPLQPS